MSGKCKTCIYWSPVEEFLDDPMGECTCPKINPADSDPYLTDGLTVGTIDDHAVVLFGKDFGCIHHKADK